MNKAKIFHELHKKGDPVILFNVWDAGTAKAVADAGARAIATGSWSVAAANGFSDAEEMPMGAAIGNLERISAAVDLPVTLDFEGGYAVDAAGLKLNIAKVIATGAVGINFEDQIIGGEGLFSIEQQSERIKAIREAADEREVSLFINARCDLFLKNGPETHADHLAAAIERSIAYAEAGASGFFAPGLKDAKLIGQLCSASTMPVNIMAKADGPSNQELSSLGVARISYGPEPYRQMIEQLRHAAAVAFASGEDSQS
jgi:2-methylisocitrate lyase-like PEP mutase family enzyme